MAEKELHYEGLGYMCKYDSCSRWFKTRASLKRHYTSHGIKPHKCPYCHKRFLTSSEVTNHAYVHTNGKPFVCDNEGCGKNFKDAWKLTAHMKKHTLLELSESSSEDDSATIGMSCTFDTLETVLTQIESFEYPNFFYTKVLPPPPSLKSTHPPFFVNIVPMPIMAYSEALTTQQPLMQSYNLCKLPQ